MTCPKCNSTHLRKSKSANARLVFPFSLLMVWVRCHSCGRKFRQYGLFPGNQIPEASDPRRVAA
jgi:RNase P subunit RPR2